MNRADECAVEEALRIREASPGTSVEAITSARPGGRGSPARPVLGADRGSTSCTGRARSMPGETAALIAAAVREMRYDLVLAGVMAEDTMQAQTARCWRHTWDPCATAVMPRPSCRTEAGAGRAGARRRPPALWRCASRAYDHPVGINRPRYPALSTCYAPEAAADDTRCWQPAGRAAAGALRPDHCARTGKKDTVLTEHRRRRREGWRRSSVKKRLCEPTRQGQEMGGEIVSSRRARPADGPVTAELIAFARHWQDVSCRVRVIALGNDVADLTAAIAATPVLPLSASRAGTLPLLRRGLDGDLVPILADLNPVSSVSSYGQRRRFRTGSCRPPRCRLHHGGRCLPDGCRGSGLPPLDPPGKAADGDRSGN